MVPALLGAYRPSRTGSGGLVVWEQLRTPAKVAGRAQVLQTTHSRARSQSIEHESFEQSGSLDIHCNVY